MDNAGYPVLLYAVCFSVWHPYKEKIKKGNEQTKENEATKEKDGQKGEGTEDHAEFVLIGKSRSFSPIIPQVPSASSSENSEQNSNNFAPQNSEKKEDMKEEDNEMDVDFERSELMRMRSPVRN